MANVWPATQSQLYGELNKLADAGLIVVSDIGPRGRKEYRITEAGRHAVIAEALIQVTAGLGLEAVAEGVETAEQAEALSRRGYRLLQGYHFGRPVAEPDFGLVQVATN